MTKFVKTLAALAVLASPALAEAPRSIIVMDGSGSMWGQIDGRAKLEIARETVATVLGGIPADQELGLMAYGHREKGNCSDIELIVSPAPGTGAEIAAQVAKMRFLGKTPLSESVRQAAEALRYGETAATVVLVTDGLETCDADPCALARELEATGLNFTAHVIGFGLSGAEGAQVACLATETGGQYLQASDARGLADALAATVTAKLPPPQPAPVPEAEPALPTASLTLPETAPAGSLLRIDFAGPHEEYDYVRILDANGEWLAEAVVEGEPFVDIRLPFKTGPHEVVYLFKANEIIARSPLTLTEAPVSISAPDMAQVGSTVTLTWVGPEAPLDNIQLWSADTGERWGYDYTTEKASMDWTMPDVPGVYEFRYVFLDSETIYTRPITVTLDKVEAAPAPGLIVVPVSLSVPAEYADQPINWSAEPLDPHPDAPEALAMVEALPAPWRLDLYPGRWRIYGEAPAGVSAGQGFGTDITVTDAMGQMFEIPLSPMETMGMGEDVPTGDGPVQIWIKPQYDAILTRWQATPVSGQNSEVLGTDYQPGGWQAALDSGRWLIEGFAEGGGGHLYAAALDVSPNSPPEIWLARTASMSQSPLALPNGDTSRAHCLGDAGCYYNDQAGALRYVLLPDWAASAALFYETAGGVAAKVPSVDFYTGSPLQVMASLNPRQWDAMLGPCSDTALGQLCSATQADPAAVALLTTSLAAASTAPRTAATSAPVTGEPRLQTDGSAMQIDTPLDLPKGFDPVELLAPQLMSME